MAWIAPSTRAVGAVVTAAMWNADIVANTKYLAKPASMSVTRSTDQELATPNVWRSVAWNTEQWDTDTMWSSTAATRIDINTPGKYLVTASLTWELTASAATMQIGIYAGAVGSSTSTPNQRRALQTPVTNKNAMTQITAMLALTSTSTVRIQAMHSSTGSLDIVHSTAAEVPYCNVLWVSS